MMYTLLVCSLLGTAAGIVTGLVPGIHVNTAAPLSLAIASSCAVGPLAACTFICSMSLTHTFIDFIPSTLLGIPEEDTAVSVLPAHNMVHQGRGLEAIRLSGVSSLFAVCVLVTLSWPVAKALAALYPVVRALIPAILTALLIMMVYSHRAPKKMLMAAGICAISGAFGMVVLSSPWLCKDPLFPVFSGMFGVSTLLASASTTHHIPEQDQDSGIRMERPQLVRSLALGTLSGSFVALVPGIGASQAALISLFGSKESHDRAYIATCCSINTANALFALMALRMFGVARNGALVHVRSILGELTAGEYGVLAASMCLSAGIAYPALLALSRLLLPVLQRVRYRTVSAAGILIQGGLVWALTGRMGVLLCLVATCVGLMPITAGVHRSTVMSFLMIPVLQYYI